MLDTDDLGRRMDGAMTNLKMEFASLRDRSRICFYAGAGNGGRLRRNNSYQPSWYC